MPIPSGFRALTTLQAFVPRNSRGLTACSRTSRCPRSANSFSLSRRCHPSVVPIVAVSSSSPCYIWEIKVKGRSLWQVYDAHARHAAPWIQQATRDFEDGKAVAVIVKIEVPEVEGEQEGIMLIFEYAC